MCGFVWICLVLSGCEPQARARAHRQLPGDQSPASGGGEEGEPAPGALGIPRDLLSCMSCSCPLSTWGTTQEHTYPPVLPPTGQGDPSASDPHI